MNTPIGQFLIATLIATSANVTVASGAHRVSVVSSESVAKTAQLKLPAQVETKLGSGSSIHAYILKIKIPTGAVPDLRESQFVDVTLPLVRNRRAKAEVISISEGLLSLRLSNQVQQLDAQTLIADIPLKKDNLFFVPSQAIYSPRGIEAQVFILKSNQTTELVPVSIIQSSDKGQILVSSHALLNAKVIFKGLENLVVGETVEVSASEGVKP